MLRTRAKSRQIRRVVVLVTSLPAARAGLILNMRACKRYNCHRGGG